MPAAAQPQPAPGPDGLLPRYAAVDSHEPRLSASVRLERLIGRELATVLVRGLARRLR